MEFVRANLICQLFLPQKLGPILLDSIEELFVGSALFTDLVLHFSNLALQVVMCLFLLPVFNLGWRLGFHDFEPSFINRI